MPAGLHWDEWIGPAAFREYHEELHPLQWRSWWEFGDGSVGDWGCHNLDGPFMALKLGPADQRRGARAGRRQRRAVSRCGTRSAGDFPARGDMPPVKVYWYDGYHGATGSVAHDESDAGLKQNRPPIVEEIEKKYNRELKNGGTIYVGTRGSCTRAITAERPADHSRGEAEGVPRARRRRCRGWRSRPDGHAPARFPPRLQGRASRPARTSTTADR